MRRQAGAEAEPHQHLVGDEQGAVAPRRLLEMLEVAGAGRNAAGIGQHGLDDHRRDVLALGEERLRVGLVVVAQQQHAAVVGARVAERARLRRAGVAERLLVVPAVVAGRHLGHAGPARDGPGDAAGEVDGLAARIGEGDAGQGCAMRGERRRGSLLGPMREGRQRAIPQRLLAGRRHGRMGMAQDGAAEAERGVDVAVALVVPQVGTRRAGDVEGAPRQGAAGTGDAADQMGCRHVSRVRKGGGATR